MKIIKRDHSPINLRNEINIKINNNAGADKKQSEKQFRDSEERALKRLNNMEYANRAILMNSGNRQQNLKQSSQHFIQPVQQPFQQPSYPPNLLDRTINGVGALFKSRETNDPNEYSTNTTPSQTATVDFLDDEGELITDSKEFRDLPASQQLFLLEDAKRKAKGRPKGSKNRPKKVSVEQEVQTEPMPFHSQFDDTGIGAIFESENDQTLKSSDFKKSNPYVKFLSMNQVPERPDRNVNIKEL
jgi:hypothetical protein